MSESIKIFILFHRTQQMKANSTSKVCYLVNLCYSQRRTINFCLLLPGKQNLQLVSYGQFMLRSKTGEVKLFACCSLLVSFCSLYVTFCSLLVSFCWLLVTFFSLLVTFSSLLVTFSSLLVTFSTLIVTFCLLLDEKL